MNLGARSCCLHLMAWAMFTLGALSWSLTLTSQVAAQSFRHAPAGTTSGSGQWQPCKSPLQWAALVDGQYVFSVVGTDRVGNVAAPATADFTVDTTPPSISNVVLPIATRASNFTVVFSVADAGSGVAAVECRHAPDATRSTLREGIRCHWEHAAAHLTGALCTCNCFAY